MILILVIAGVLALGLAAAAIVLRSGVPGVADPVTTEAFEPLPRGIVRPAQVTELRFDQAIRGYRMAQVDEVLDQLTEELRDRDAEVARLRAELAATPVDFTGREGQSDDPHDVHEAGEAPQAGESDRGDL
ncbi:DivIVA domain-containing protein [Ornithinimicrobium sp. F0845]|uniref:DivIVA domain-containing protein n=1 Tax=Ornithinimicrobium sp. F0845 TaxID=2926412 RepID=UPI001FF49F73|nr:DivIVA domain-containing protein [Ornithinimicrobium sp. F0845]